MSPLSRNTSFAPAHTSLFRPLSSLITALLPPSAAGIQSEWAGGPPQPLNPRLYPPLRAYKTGPDRAGKSWVFRIAQGCSRTSPFLRLIPPLSIILSLFFRRLFLRIIHPHPIHHHHHHHPHSTTVAGPSFCRPVACIARLPKWFARLKSLRTNTRLYLGPKKSR